MRRHEILERRNAVEIKIEPTEREDVWKVIRTKDGKVKDHILIKTRAGAEKQADMWKKSFGGR